MAARVRIAPAPTAPAPPPLVRQQTTTTTAVREQQRKAQRVPGIEGLDDRPPAICVVGPSTRVYQGHVLWNLLPADQPRKRCIQLVEHWLFEPSILLTIACTCITMAVDSPLDPPGTWKAQVIIVCEWLYLLVFSAEMLARVVAYGAFQYARDSWCQLDLATVLLSWAFVLLPGFGNFNVIRALRGLRPLRALKHIPGMPSLVQAIVASLPKVATVILLVGFLVILFALIAVQIFQGSLHYRCAIGGAEVGGDVGTCNPERLTSLSDTGFGHAEQCAVVGASCDYFVANPNSGLFTFDSVVDATVPIMLVLTFDDWSALMYLTMGATSAWACANARRMRLKGSNFDPLPPGPPLPSIRKSAWFGNVR